MDNKRTHLQKVLGDDNVLVVKFMVPSDNNADFYRQQYHKIVEDGIVLGLRLYRFFGESLSSCNAKSIWIYWLLATIHIMIIIVIFVV